jgi:N-acetylglucosaminyl-diphospho-decaprenol L-rhamnosyltransferase
MIDVSVVAVTYRSATHILELLASVPPACRGLTYEVILVENASNDGIHDALGASGTSARLITLRSNVGFAAAVSVGVAAARGVFICCVNPDARLAPDSILNLVAAADRRPGHLLYAGRIRTPRGDIEPGSVQPLPSLREYVTFALGVSLLRRWNTRWDPTSLTQWDGEQEQVVPAVAGTFLLARRAEFLDAGGFDERFFMYSEDIDLCYRALQRGTPPLLVPAAEAVHLTGASSSDQQQRCMLYTGKATFVRLHWPPAKRRLALAAMTAGVGLRALIPPRWSKQPEWVHLWRTRREWRKGWPVTTAEACAETGRQDPQRGLCEASEVNGDARPAVVPQDPVTPRPHSAR